jgi:hypothetical protein
VGCSAIGYAVGIASHLGLDAEMVRSDFRAGTTDYTVLVIKLALGTQKLPLGESAAQS